MKSIVEYMKSRRGYYKVENSIVDLSKLDKRTAVILKGVIGKLILEGEPSVVIKEVHSIYEALSMIDPSIVRVIGKPEACSNWGGPLDQLRIIKENPKRR
ncbi:hypothetical protein QO209_05250 [Pseudomonas citronellolis]|uniref:hypothetical protein n=1 Tax=Pseudomonas citronellolis TaxID=53408 RepID=UPI00264852EB|nr:hypothetical protein [Pseudomonas citronellolis]MDN6871842.1 hypothetical protein [Pseudomonas citronellolis]